MCASQRSRNAASHKFTFMQKMQGKKTVTRAPTCANSPHPVFTTSYCGRTLSGKRKFCCKITFLYMHHRATNKFCSLMIYCRIHWITIFLRNVPLFHLTLIFLVRVLFHAWCRLPLSHRHNWRTKYVRIVIVDAGGDDINVTWTWQPWTFSDAIFVLLTPRGSVIGRHWAMPEKKQHIKIPKRGMATFWKFHQVENQHVCVIKFEKM